MNWLPGKQILNNALFQSIKYSKKKLLIFYADNKIQKIIGDVFYPNCKTKIVITFQSI